jgi:hypothetical protein
MLTSSPSSPRTVDNERFWTTAVLIASAPVLIVLCVTLWRTPFPITETIAFIEDAADRPVMRLLNPDTSFYRPLFYITLSGLWHSGATLEMRLAAIKVLTMVPAIVLVLALIWYFRPRSAIEASAAALAVAVLIGSAGFRENLEIGIAQTIVGMPLALIVWIILDREVRNWHTPVVIALTLVAIGFKEQGLVILPLVIIARWTRAPGATRGMAAAVAVIGVAYVLVRLSARGTWEVFEQDIGLGFTELDRFAAAERFGAFPYWVYAYTAAGTMGNVLFAEPTRGVFRIVHAAFENRIEPWHVIHLASSVALTTIVMWWGVRHAKRAIRGQWSPESRLFVAAVIALLVTGLLSFNYSRGRLGGMAVVFYAAAVFFAVRAAALRVSSLSPARFAAAALALMLIAAAWQTRAIATVEWVRAHSSGNQQEWFVRLPSRRVEFAHRAFYLNVMESMIEQGTDPAAPRPTRYPDWARGILGE